MYCIKCGNKINDSDKYCTGCGNRIENNIDNKINNFDNERNNTAIVLGIISLSILSISALFWIFAPVALILSIVGLIMAIKNGKMVDIIVNGVGIFMSLLICVFMFLIVMFINEVRDNGRFDDDWYYGNSVVETY